MRTNTALLSVSPTLVNPTQVKTATQEFTEEFAAADAAKKEEVDARNEADSMVYQCEQALSEMGDKLSADDKKSIEDAVANVKSALQKNETAAIKESTEALKKAFFSVSEKMYQIGRAHV